LDRKVHLFGGSEETPPEGGHERDATGRWTRARAEVEGSEKSAGMRGEVEGSDGQPEQSRSRARRGEVEESDKEERSEWPTKTWTGSCVGSFTRAFLHKYRRISYFGTEGVVYL
jgi:hypothetical protein